jgi:hypothetical protein
VAGAGESWCAALDGCGRAGLLGTPQGRQWPDGLHHCVHARSHGLHKHTRSQRKHTVKTWTEPRLCSTNHFAVSVRPKPKPTPINTAHPALTSMQPHPHQASITRTSGCKSRCKHACCHHEMLKGLLVSCVSPPQEARMRWRLPTRTNRKPKGCISPSQTRTCDHRRLL